MQDQTNSTVIVNAFDVSHLCKYFSEHSPQPMIAVEGETCIVRHVNAAFLSLVGSSRDDLLGRPFAEVVPEGECNGCVGLLDRVYRTGIPEVLPEQKHGDSTPAFYWSYAVWAIFGADRHPIGVMIQVTDTTETAVFRERAVAMNERLVLSGIRQQELTEKSEALGERLQAAITAKEYFIAVLSHELRTPLTPVLLAASVLKGDVNLDQDTREIMDMIHRNIAQEARLIDDLLDMTRMERGKLNLDRTPTDLQKVLSRSVDSCRADLETGSLTLVVETLNGPLIVDADTGRLQQVFSNLLRNAIKFTPAGGRIQMRASRDGDSCRVQITDTGAGMDAEFVPRAFSAFEQGDRASARRSGLGLGLAICKTIMDLHGGTISVKSDGKDQGSTFEVRLPALAGVAQRDLKQEDDRAPNAVCPVKPLRILLVEDHLDTARLMRRLLTAEGHDVQWAGDVATALQLAGANEFDMLLSDIGLPDGNGVDLMRALRQSGSTLPGIVLSGYGQDHDIAHSLEAGFAAHLVKPLSLRKLHVAITTLLS